MQKFEGLKKLDNYTEEDIENLFKYNADLLSMFHNDPDNLFNNKDLQITKINNLIITGGEPTLNSIAILQIIKHIISKNINVENLQQMVVHIINN